MECAGNVSSLWSVPRPDAEQAGKWGRYARGQFWGDFAAGRGLSRLGRIKGYLPKAFTRLGSYLKSTSPSR
jgi:hypothetical protein